VARESAKDISNPNVFIRPDHHYKKRKLPDHTLWVAHPLLSTCAWIMFPGT
jgi:hypothetical protein